MLDDAKIRLAILKRLPALEAWRLEMEEIDFGEAIGCTVRGEDNRLRHFKTVAFEKSGAEKREGVIAYELATQIQRSAQKAAADGNDSLGQAGR
jgi:hypothetical protein